MKAVKRIIWVLLAAVLIAGSLAACGSKASSGSDAAATGGGTDGDKDFYAQENTIRLSSPEGQVRTALNILAKELGYYDEEGVNVELVNITGTDALAAISSGSNDIDALATGIIPDLVFAAQGSDIVVFAGTATEGSAIIARADDVERFKDITPENYENITISTQRNSTSWITMRGVFKEMGIDVDTITVKEIDSQVDVAQAVVKGEADLGFLPTEYANATRELGVEIVYETGELKPNYVCCRQVSSAAKLQEKRSAFVAFEIANLRTWEFYQDEANRDVVISTLAKQSGQTEDYVNEYLFVNRTKLDQNPNEAGVKDTYEYLKQASVIDEDCDAIDNHIDLSIFEEALSTLLEREPENEFYQQLLTAYREQNPSATI
ncbi:MAG: ABC transporter substrate-binding protein [Oscillospiraceae bacterium]|nr:ABC transporter substrate-binding protein [Oscillospiraceae bacterium]